MASRWEPIDRPHQHRRAAGRGLDDSLPNDGAQKKAGNEISAFMTHKRAEKVQRGTAVPPPC